MTLTVTSDEQPPQDNHPSNVLRAMLGQCEPLRLAPLLDLLRERTRPQAVIPAEDHHCSELQDLARVEASVTYLPDRGQFVHLYDGWWDILGFLVTGNADSDPVIAVHRQENVFLHGPTIHDIAVLTYGRYTAAHDWKPEGLKPSFTRDAEQDLQGLNINTHEFLASLRFHPERTLGKDIIAALGLNKGFGSAKQRTALYAEVNKLVEWGYLTKTPTPTENPDNYHYTINIDPTKAADDQKKFGTHDPNKET